MSDLVSVIVQPGGARFFQSAVEHVAVSGFNHA